MKVLMSGGGTAGHVYPALTVAELLVAEHDEVVFVGTPQGLEATLVPAASIDFRPLAASGFDRARPLTLLTSSLRILLSAFRAWRLLGAEKPDVVLGFGGYVSIPVGLAAVLRDVPLLLHEQNSVPGLANRFLSRWARAVGVTYRESITRLARPERAFVVGNPVRESVLKADRASGRAALGLPAEAQVLLVFGGSRGARHLNKAMIKLRDRLMAIDRLAVVHVAGRAEVESVRAALDRAGGDEEGRWRVLDYLDDMGSALAAADLVVARAGATSIAEITALGIPALLVPYPYATDDHQTLNASMMLDHGAASLVADSSLGSPRFGDELVTLLGDDQRRANMAAASKELGRPDAASRLVGLCRDASPHQSRERDRDTND